MNMKNELKSGFLNSFLGMGFHHGKSVFKTNDDHQPSFNGKYQGNGKFETKLLEENNENCVLLGFRLVSQTILLFMVT